MSHSDSDIALSSARRKAARMADLYPNSPYVATGYASNGREIPAPYCGGGRETWTPPPGAKYTVAVINASEERVCTLHQPS